MYPKVTIITPTANRPLMLKRCIAQFEAQDYSGETEMYIIGSNVKDYRDIGSYQNVTHRTIPNGTIPDKLNYACEQATGEIILRFDDDDYYAPDWITKSVQFLIESKADLTGLNHAYFYRPNNALFEYHYTGEQPYILGATMCFWKKTWENSKRKFYSISKIKGKPTGEDKNFCVNNGLVLPHNYTKGFMAMLHGGNTSSQFVTTNRFAKRVDISIVNDILNAQRKQSI